MPSQSGKQSRKERSWQIALTVPIEDHIHDPVKFGGCFYPFCDCVGFYEREDGNLEEGDWTPGETAIFLASMFLCAILIIILAVNFARI